MTRTESEELLAARLRLATEAAEIGTWDFDRPQVAAKSLVYECLEDIFDPFVQGERHPNARGGWRGARPV